MENPLTDEQMSIIQHALGVDKYGQSPYDTNRDYFLTSATSREGIQLEAMVKSGLFVNCGANFATGGSNCYRVTYEGKRMFYANCPHPPKKTAGQIRYQKYIDMDCGITFAEFLGIKPKPKPEKKYI